MNALIWPVAAYGCESWIMRKVDEMKISAYESNCARGVLRILYTAKIIKVEVWEILKDSSLLLQSIKTRKLVYLGVINVSQKSISIENTAFTGLAPGNSSRVVVSMYGYVACKYKSVSDIIY